MRLGINITFVNLPFSALLLLLLVLVLLLLLLLLLLLRLLLPLKKYFLYKIFFHSRSFEFRFSLPRKTLVCDLSPRSRRLATALREFAKGKSSSSSSSWVAHACMYNGADFLVLKLNFPNIFFLKNKYEFEFGYFLFQIPVLGTWLSGGVFSSGDPGLGAKVVSGQIRTLVKSLASSVPVVFSSPGTAGKAKQAAKEVGQR